MQFLPRTNVCELIILSLMLYGHYGVANDKIMVDASEIQQIRAALNLPDNDKGVMRVSEYEYENGQAVGDYTRKPFMYQQILCVLESYSISGTKVDGRIHWNDSGQLSLRRYRLIDSPTSCNFSREDEPADVVYVHDPVKMEVVQMILLNADSLFQQIIALPEGANYGTWLEYRIRTISIPHGQHAKTHSDDLYGISFRSPGKLSGPSAIFRLVGGQFRLESLGFWIS